MAHHLLGAPLVTEKNIVSIFFGKNVVKSGEAKKFKLWSNNGQTNYSRILVLLNNYFSFFEFWSNLVKLLIQEILVLLNNYCFLKQ